MGCCGGSRRSITSPTNPMLCGEPDGLVTRVELTMGYRGVQAREIAWVTGTRVPGLIARGLFIVREG
jgi:hypothetical protein